MHEGLPVWIDGSLLVMKEHPSCLFLRNSTKLWIHHLWTSKAVRMFSLHSFHSFDYLTSSSRGIVAACWRLLCALHCAKDSLELSLLHWIALHYVTLHDSLLLELEQTSHGRLHSYSIIYFYASLYLAFPGFCIPLHGIT